MAQADPQPVATVSGAEADQAVDAIVASGVLGKGDRRAELLRYLVAQETAGKGEAIKAFSIAVDVLGRDASFDPNTDSIVRSEVGRLREALRLFYAEMAPDDLVRIEIPKGSYRPVLTPVATPEAPPLPRPGARLAAIGGIVLLGLAVLGAALFAMRSPEAPPIAVGEQDTLEETPYEVVRIAVTPFLASGTNPNTERLAFGFYAELSMDLSAYPWISVIAPVGGNGEMSALDADYVLQGEVFWDGDVLRGTTRLLEMPEQAVIWNEVDTVNADVRTIEAEIIDRSSKIAAEVGALRGIAPDLVKAQNARASDEGLDAFLCFLGMYLYLEAPTDAQHASLRECLTRSVASHPTFGDGWAALALIYMDEARFDRNPRPGTNPWADADRAVAQALRYEPLRMPVLNSALVESIEAPDRDLAAFEQHADRLLNLFPRHTGTLVNVGSREAEFAGRWDEGEALIDRAIALHPDPPSTYFVTNAYRAALEGDAASAAKAVEPLTVTTSRTELLLNYLAEARAGSVTEMRRYRALLADQGLVTFEDIRAHVLDRRYVAELEVALLEQLEAARAREEGG